MKIFIIIGVYYSILSCGLKDKTFDNSLNFTIYCFENGYCTDTIFSGANADNENYLDIEEFKKKYETINIKRINPNQTSSKEILDQFIFAMLIENGCLAKKGNQKKIPSLDYYFENNQFIDTIIIEVDESKIKLINMAKFSQPNFNNNIGKLENENSVFLLFGNDGAEMQMSKDFYYKKSDFFRYRHLKIKNL